MASGKRDRDWEGDDKGGSSEDDEGDFGFDDDEAQDRLPVNPIAAAAVP